MAGMKHTKAYVVWRTHSQQMLDFAVLVTTAVPQLDHALKARTVDPSSFLATNTAFRPSNDPFSTEKRAIPKHEKVMGATLLLSIFSHFETYFFSVIDEIIAFHGDVEVMETVIRSQYRAADAKPPLEATNYLRKEHEDRLNDRFRRFSAEIRSQGGIMWPSQRFMLFGFKQFAKQRKTWKPVNIPEIIRDVLGIDFCDADRDRFHNIRDERNKIAHGKNLNFELKKAMDASKFFLALSRTIEEAVLSKFLIVERFAH